MRRDVSTSPGAFEAWLHARTQTEGFHRRLQIDADVAPERLRRRAARLAGAAGAARHGQSRAGLPGGEPLRCSRSRWSGVASICVWSVRDQTGAAEAIGFGLGEQARRCGAPAPARSPSSRSATTGGRHRVQLKPGRAAAVNGAGGHWTCAPTARRARATRADVDRDRVGAAFDFADQAHGDQRRESDSRSSRTRSKCAESSWRCSRPASTHTLACAALLHDVGRGHRDHAPDVRSASARRWPDWSRA